MNMSRLITHAQQGKGDKFRGKSKENKMSRTGNCNYYKNKLDCGNHSQSQQ